MTTFVIPDVHGAAELLDSALNLIFLGAREGDVIVFTGDYVDRGPDSRRVIRTLRAGSRRPDVGWVCLQGNHERLMLDACNRNRPLDVHNWLVNGGNMTLLSYGHPENEPVNLTHVDREDLDWLGKLPLFYVDPHRVYVHAGIDPGRGLDEQEAFRLQWHLYPENENSGYRGRHVVHGHHEHDEPVLLPNRTGLDVGAWRRGVLAVGVFDGPGGPRDILFAV